MHLKNVLLGTTRCWAPAEDPQGAAPAADPTPAPAAEPAVAAATPAAEPAPAQASAPPKDDWKDRRIAELTAKLNAAKREAPAPAAAPAQAPGETKEQFEARVQEAALAIAQAQDWNSRCNAVVEQGRKEFQDFNDRLGVIQKSVNAQDAGEVAAYNDVMASAMETGHAAKLIHELGAQPGKFQDLMRLSPTKRAMQLAQMASKYESGPGAPEPSGAPKPITPIESRGVHYDGLNPAEASGAKLPIREWMARREKQAQEAGIQ